MEFGEVVIGPPGSGKTTYIVKTKQKMSRKVVTINLDPGNETHNFFDYNIREHFVTRTYMEQKDVGPNNAVKEIMEAFSDGVNEYLGPVLDQSQGCFVIFDFPGQIEFFMSGGSLAKILRFLTQKGIVFVIVNLFDVLSFYGCFNRVSAYLVATLSMALLEAPQVCVISKCDNIEKYNDKIDLEAVACVDTSQEDLGSCKFLAESMEFVTSMSLLKFQVLDMQNDDTWVYLRLVLDEVCGYTYEHEDEISKMCNNIPTAGQIFEKYQSGQ